MAKFRVIHLDFVTTLEQPVSTSGFAGVYGVSGRELVCCERRADAMYCLVGRNLTFEGVASAMMDNRCNRYDCQSKKQDEKDVTR